MDFIEGIKKIKREGDTLPNFFGGKQLLLIALCIVGIFSCRLVIYSALKMDIGIKKAEEIIDTHTSLHRWSSFSMSYVGQYMKSWKWLYIWCRFAFYISWITGFCGLIFYRHTIVGIIIQTWVDVICALTILMSTQPMDYEYDDFIIEKTRTEYEKQKQDWEAKKNNPNFCNKERQQYLKHMNENLHILDYNGFGRWSQQRLVPYAELDWVYDELVWLRLEYQREGLFFKGGDTLTFWIFPEKYKKKYQKAKKIFFSVNHLQMRQEKILICPLEDYLFRIVEVYSLCLNNTGFPNTTIPNLMENVTVIQEMLSELERLFGEKASDNLKNSVSEIREDTEILRKYLPTGKRLPNGHYWKDTK